jgi:hypothetical protein
MPSLSEAHALVDHLPIFPVPVLARLVVLERMGRRGDRTPIQLTAGSKPQLLPYCA